MKTGLIGLVFLLACRTDTPPAERGPGGSPGDAGADGSSDMEGGATVELFDAIIPLIDATPHEGTVTVDDCEPGTYVGKYTCRSATSVFPEGALQFELVINDTKVEDDGCVEFCSDLVIKAGTGTLTGLWAGVVDFNGQLEGGLDCGSGKFAASVTDGVWGPWGLPAGKFAAALNASYAKGPPAAISGTWEVKPEGTLDGACSGEFNLERMDPTTP
jgi:hypothetical protein